MSIDIRAANQGLVGKPMVPVSEINGASSLTSATECDTIDGVREVPIASLAPGRRFELVLTATSKPPYKRLRGTLIRKGPGTVAVVLDNAERERSFTTQEGSTVTLRTAGGIVYWSPGTPVLDIHEVRDIARWTTRGGTGVGDDMHHPDNYNSQAPDGEKSEDTVGERVATLPGMGGKAKTAKSNTGKIKVVRSKAVKELHPCLCGCGDKVAGRFRQGHDGRYYSILKKVASGDMKHNEMPKGMQSQLGTVADVKKALRESKH